MSAFSRLLGVLGRVYAVRKDAHWGDRSSVRMPKRLSSPRYRVSSNEALVGWWVGEKFCKFPAKFRVLSLKRALIVMRRIPPGEDVWGALVKPVRTSWYVTQVHRVKENLNGLVDVELLFRGTSDANHFKALISKGEFNAKLRWPRLRRRY